MTRPLAAACLLLLAQGPFVALGQDEARDTSTTTQVDAQRVRDLEQRVAQLERQLIEANATIRALQDENQRMRQSLRDAGQPVPEAAPAPQKPEAAPESLFHDLVRRYRETFPDPMPEEPRARAKRHAEIQAWCRDVAIRQRTKTTWLAHVEEIQLQSGSAPEARLRVIDEATGLPIGDPVTIEMPRRLASRIVDAERFERWELTGLLIPRPTYNARRDVVGVFNVPRFVGPFVEFDFEFQVTGVAGVDADDDRVRTNPDRE